MSITDELRELAHGFNGPWKRNEEMLLAIADRIDAEHESKVSYWQDASYKDGYDEGFASADDYFTDKRETLEEHGWVKLPVDADGEYIHFGDVLDQFGTPMTVYAMSDPDPNQGDCMLELITDGISDSTWVRARKMRHHHHAPTVEDVLREFALTVCKDDALTIRRGVVEEFAKRLTLVEMED